MIALEKLETALVALKELVAERKRYNRLRDKEFKASDDANVSRKRREKLHSDVNWQAMDVTRREHHAHKAIVEAGLAEPYGDEYYGDTILRPDAWHEIRFNRDKPQVGVA